MGRKRGTALQEAAAAAAAAAVAASQGASNDQLLGVTDDDDDPDTADVAEDVLEGLRRLDQGQRVTWYVYCDTPGRTGASEGYVEKLRTEHLDEARFKLRYGPGEYRVFGRTADGHYVRGSHKTIKISDIGAEPGSLTANPHDPVALLREMRTADEQRAAKRTEELKTYASILAAPIATLGAALIARRPALDLPALITALRPQQNTLAEMTTALTNLRQLSGGESNSLDVALKVLDKIQDLPTGQQGEIGWLGFFRDLIREAAPHARELLTQLQQRSVGPGQLPPGSTSGPAFGPGVAPSLPAGAPTLVTNGSAGSPSSPSGVMPGSSSQPAQPFPTPTLSPSPSQSTTEAADMWRVVEPWLRRKAEELHESAASNMPVELCAEMLLMQVEKKWGAVVTSADLAAIIARPDWWQHVVSFYPAIEVYQAWMTDLRQELLSMLEEDARTRQPQQPQEPQT